MIGNGNYGGFNYRYRVLIGSQILGASDNEDSAIEQVNLLRGARACTPIEYLRRCELLGQGNYGGFNFRYRVGIEGEPIYASDSYDSALTFMQKLRSNSLCR